MYPILDELTETLEQVSGGKVEVEPFLLPPDMMDRFFMTGWRNPEWYLDPLFRQGVSPLANAPADVVDRCVNRLQGDLKTGIWQKKYGKMLDQAEFDGGYRFLVAMSR